VRGTLSSNQTVIVGLGNPGKGYARHRHNIGFAAVEEIAARQNGRWESKWEKSLICRAQIDDTSIVLIKPMTYMNLSGTGVLPVLRRFNADPSRMIVVHDDMDLTAGKVRIKVGGGDGGHRGIRSIADSLRFRDFTRVRLGIGRPPPGVAPEEFVLSPFDHEEQEVPRTLISTAVSAIEIIVIDGVERAQNLIHSGKLAACDAGFSR